MDNMPPTEEIPKYKIEFTTNSMPYTGEDPGLERKLKVLKFDEAPTLEEQEAFVGEFCAGQDKRENDRLWEVVKAGKKEIDFLKKENEELRETVIKLCHIEHNRIEHHVKNFKP